MAKNSFLLTRPNHEPAVNYLFYWAEKALAKAKEKNIFIVDLAGKEANKGKFSWAVKKFKPSFVFLNGHGSPNMVTGFNNEPIVKFADNEKILKDTVTYALSCSSAKRLGKSCVAEGAKTYLGYDEDYIFVFDEEKENDPLNDKTAGYFLNPSSRLVETILNEKTTGEAFQDSQNTFKETIQKFSLSESTAEERELLPYLLWDMEHQLCLGQKEAKAQFTKGETDKTLNNNDLFLGLLVLILGTIFMYFVLFY